MTDENIRIRELADNYFKGKETGNKLIYDQDNMTIRESSPRDNPNRTLKLTPEIMTVYSEAVSNSGIIVLSGEILQSLTEKQNDIFFTGWDEEDVYSLICWNHVNATIPGTILFNDKTENVAVKEVGKNSDQVRVIIPQQENQPCDGDCITYSSATGYILHDKTWKQVPVQIVPVKDEIFSRFGGLLETDDLAKKKVLIIGLGTGGAHIAIEFAKAGVGHIYVIDDDILEVGNIARHVAPLSHTGRKKTNSIVDLIHEKNPYAKVYTLEEKVCHENKEKIREIVKNMHFNVCATDTEDSRKITNRVCVEENKPCIFAGAFRRAYGGQIFSVRPYQTPCYQCFLMMLPDEAKEEEISSPKQAQRVAYADRPVPVEAGLATDVANINLMVVKLVMQSLLKDKETTFRSLDDDLVASWYLWLNRREINTQYEKLQPLEYNIDGVRVLRWYGVKAQRQPGCPVCGDYEKHIAAPEEINLKNFMLNIKKY